MNRPTTMDEIGHYVIARISKTTEVVGLAWNVAWNNSISITHSAPKGCSTNWDGHGKDKKGNPLPHNYPGWYGRVWIRYKRKPEAFRSSRLLVDQCIHTGTGGFGSYDGIWTKIAHAHWLAKSDYEDRPDCYSWDVRFFDADWPEAVIPVLEQFEKDLAWAKLSNGVLPKTPSHSFRWEAPEQVKADEEFLAKTLHLMPQI